MIRNQWYIVLDSHEVRDKPVGVTRMGEQLVFWRDSEGRVVCFYDRCVHRGVALSAGKVLPNGCLQCPFHGFEYDSTGRVTVIPANGRRAPVPQAFRVQSYPTHEAHGFIWIWWGEEPPADLQPPRFFEDLTDGFRWAQIIDPWKAHYSRVIENQLDPVHLPFVHHNTIGRGNRTVVDGPGFVWVDENRFRIYALNRVDDGTPARKAEEVDITKSKVYLDFIFPNLWQNHISEDVRIVAAFVPVDEEHTLLYLRFYQRFLTAPILGDLVTRLAMPFNRLVAHQDRRVVETQRPRPSALRMDERLIRGDRPIVEYRRRREELKARRPSPSELLSSEPRT
jgi:phenylpropionate dioxygenase-like ring-hydroxylating dioxygenase large terminal subunit